MAVAALALHQYFPSGTIQSSKQCCRAVTKNVTGDTFYIT